MLMNPVDHDKPIVLFYVFGFALEWKQLRSAGAMLGYNVGMNGAVRLLDELQALSEPWCTRLSLVDAPWVVSTSPCLVLATNKTAADRENAQNLEGERSYAHENLTDVACRISADPVLFLFTHWP